MAAYGPDLEVVLAHPAGLGGEDLDRFVVGPAEIRALALQPKFVLFLNRTRTSTHTLVSVGQTRNFEVTIPPGEARAVQFTAGAPGRYEFYCRVPGHDRLGLTGSIVVRYGVSANPGRSGVRWRRGAARSHVVGGAGMATIVIVPGAFHGGWAWKEVRGGCRRRGTRSTR